MNDYQILQDVFFEPDVFIIGNDNRMAYTVNESVEYDPYQVFVIFYEPLNKQDFYGQLKKYASLQSQK